MVGLLPRSTPEAQGIPSSAILAFVEAADTELDSLHSFMLLRHGAVVAEGWWKPYGPHEPHMLYSLSKSFTSTAVGFLVAEGGISVDDHVVSFFPDDLPDAVSQNLAAMQVRHLLSMSTGHDEDTLSPVVRATDANWVRAFLAQPVEHEPGTHFVYNSGATYMLSAIVQKCTSLTLLDYLQPRLFGPLGIEHPTWESCPRGINTGGWGLSITTADIARFGQTYLDRGMWQGQQIVPAAWVEEATRSHISNGDDPESDWSQGYGYQFWRCRHNGYRGDGAFGQFCVVLPAQDAVVAITSGLSDMQAVLNLVWQHLLPAFGHGELPPDEAANTVLQERLATLTIEPSSGATTSAIAPRVSGKRYVLAANDWEVAAVTLRFENEHVALDMEGVRGPYTLLARMGAWSDARNGMVFFDGLTHRAQPVVAAATWTADDTLTIDCCLYQTPYIQTLRFTFPSDDALVLRRSLNVSFGPTEFEAIAGHAEPVDAPRT